MAESSLNAFGKLFAGESQRAAVVLRPKKSLHRAVIAQSRLHPKERTYLSPSEIETEYGAVDDHSQALRDFADKYGLSLAQEYCAGRLAILEGPLGAFAEAFRFDTEKEFDTDGRPLHPVEPPEELSGWVEGVFGIDAITRFVRTDRSTHMAQHLLGHRLHGVEHVVDPGAGPGGEELASDAEGLQSVEDGLADAESSSASSEHRHQLLPPSVARDRYRLPTSATGQGQTVAILVLGGGFYTEDLEQFCGGQAPSVDVVEIGGATNAPASREAIRQFIEESEAGEAPSADAALQDQIWWTLETTVDIQLAASFAPGARFVVYFAPNTTAGKLEALTAAIADEDRAPDIVSCSWGLDESILDDTDLEAFDGIFQMAILRGISLLYASGDKGAEVDTDGKARVNFPASSPHVLSCGGAQLPLKGPQSVWNESRGELVLATGGGFSRLFSRPPWQPESAADGSGHACRGVPDVAGKSDYTMGYRLVIAGMQFAGGGTSSAAPLWAGLLARINEALGVRVGWIAPLLYQPEAADCFESITEGHNGTFQAEEGWDPCTGLGTPDGEKLLRFLGGG